jgi:hypothetical protein
MSKHAMNNGLTRRELLWLSAAGAGVLGFPGVAALGEQGKVAHGSANAYEALLKTWCDGLLAHQIHGMGVGLDGALMCPSCAMIHGRCADAVYPLLRMASTSGDAKYMQAALRVWEWSEKNVSRSDGSWINDVLLSNWVGITVFRVCALGEALHHHGKLLPTAVRKSWTERMAKAAQFLDGFITIETGNVNYPVTSSYCFALCGLVLGDQHYLDRAKEMAHESLAYFSENGLLFGEGHPLNGLSPKKCHPVDLGYNVEESLPALALYSIIADDAVVRDKVIVAMRAHMEFMMPNGAWDNSWGTRNYKWSWWGSRTSDGCHPAYALMAKHDPRFHEVAQRNLELMAACTHDGLLYGGPDYFAHGDMPCIHHAFTHAKALATVLDRGGAGVVARTSLPRDEAYGLKSFPEIGTHLAAVGPWRATVTEYDWEYVEKVQTGGSGSGGHVSGGTMSMLFHRKLGAVLVASMTEYTMIEISNQQAFREGPRMTLAPRVEYDQVYTSLNDFGAVLKAVGSASEVSFDASGHLLSAKHQASKGEARYRIGYHVTESGVEIAATATVGAKFILPVVATSRDTVEQVDARTIRISKAGGVLTVTTDSSFETVPGERTFNLVPGFEAVPIAVGMVAGKEVRIRIAG